MPRKKQGKDPPAWGAAVYALVALCSLGSGVNHALSIVDPRPTVVYVLPSISFDMDTSGPSTSLGTSNPYDLNWSPFDFEKDDQHFEDVFWQQQVYDNGDPDSLELLEKAVMRDDTKLSVRPWTHDQKRAYEDLLAAQQEYQDVAQAGASASRRWDTKTQLMELRTEDYMLREFPENDDDKMVEVPLELFRRPGRRVDSDSSEQMCRPMRIGSSSPGASTPSSCEQQMTTPPHVAYFEDVSSQGSCEQVSGDEHEYRDSNASPLVENTDADDALLASLGFRFSACTLGQLSNPEYMELVKREGLDELQRQTLRAVRRRFKNRISARNSRRRRAN